MWDWDSEQTNRKKARPPIRWSIAGIVVAALVGAELFRAVLLPAVRQAARPAPAPTFDEEKAADLLFGDRLRARNPYPLDLGPVETLDLSDDGHQLKLTPGAIGSRSDPCAPAAFVTVAMTVSAARGPVNADPAAFRLAGADGHEDAVIAGCATASTALVEGRQVTVELPFAATTATWLVYAPDNGPAVGRWRLS